MNRKFCRSSSETLHDSISHEHVSRTCSDIVITWRPKGKYIYVLERTAPYAVCCGTAAPWLALLCPMAFSLGMERDVNYCHRHITLKIRMTQFVILLSTRSTTFQWWKRQHLADIKSDRSLFYQKLPGQFNFGIE